MQTFEVSLLDDPKRIPAEARLGCKICWHVYDHSEGDPVGQFPSCTPFTALPVYWRYPNCDGAGYSFMVLNA